MTIAMVEKPLDLLSCFEAQRVGVRGIEGRAMVDGLFEEKHGLAFLGSALHGILQLGK
ncbi:hypothetical protein QRQ56_26740 [Bradyrhizobium sp. U531]